MARPSLRRDRAERRRSEAAVKLIVFGVALTVAPAFVGKAFNALVPVGLIMLVAGGIFVWVGRQRSPTTTNPRAPTAPRHRDQRIEPVGGGLDEMREIFEVEGPKSRADRTATASPRPTSWSSEVFNVIEWRRFEAVVEALFQQAGFETRSQSHGADDGIDVWLYSRNHPGSPVSIVQCKHWSGKRVGVDKIRELRGVMAAKGVQRGQFATTSTFTPEATAFARGNGINLLDVGALLALIEGRTAEQQEALLAVALEGDYWRPTCVNCGIKLVDRTSGKDGTRFWGCTNYPRCRTTMMMRGR